jgi:hypothetical protein
MEFDVETQEKRWLNLASGATALGSVLSAYIPTLLALINWLRLFS